MLIYLGYHLAVDLSRISSCIDRTANIDDIDCALSKAKGILRICAAVPSYLYFGMNTADESHFFELHEARRAAILSELSTKNQHMICLFDVFLHAGRYSRLKQRYSSLDASLFDSSN